MYNEIKKDREITLEKLREILINNQMNPLGKHTTSWARAKLFLKSLPSEQFKKIYAECIMFPDIESGITLKELKGIFDMLNIKLTRKNIGSWIRARDILRNSDYKTIQMIEKIVNIIYPAIINNVTLSDLEGLAYQTHLSHSISDFQSRNSAIKWLTLLEDEELANIVKLAYIQSIFSECVSLKDLQSVIKYSQEVNFYGFEDNKFGFDMSKNFQSWGEARSFLYQKMPSFILRFLDFFYKDLLFGSSMAVGFEKEEIIKKPSHVLISYSLDELNKFKIKKIADKLKSYPNIKVRYFTKDAGEDIIEFMDEGVGWCNILLLFCSEKSKESDSVKIEWKSVLMKKKKIIPIFIEDKHIPNLLVSITGVAFDDSNLEGTIEKIYKEIFKRSEH